MEGGLFTKPRDRNEAQQQIGFGASSADRDRSSFLFTEKAKGFNPTRCHRVQGLHQQ